MPNWCECDVTVQGPEDEVARLQATVTGESPFDFNRIIPYPEEYQGEGSPEVRQKYFEIHGKMPFDGYNAGGYEWCIQNWGSKWPASEVRVDEPIQTTRGLKVVYHFDTPWGPPLPVLDELARQFPALTIKVAYYEAGNAFKGRVVWKGGGMVEHSEGSYRGSRGG